MIMPYAYVLSALQKYLDINDHAICIRALSASERTPAIMVTLQVTLHQKIHTFVLNTGKYKYHILHAYI